MIDATQDEDRFSYGDIVRLKSGGPKMAVNAVRLDGYLNCVWFEAGDTLREGVFHRDALQEVRQ